MPSRAFWITTIVGVALLGFAASVFIFQRPVHLAYWQKFHMGDALIVSIEAFKQSHGRLPESLKEIGSRATDAGPLFYHRESDTDYTLSFGTTIGESITYDSHTGKWDE